MSQQSLLILTCASSTQLLKANQQISALSAQEAVSDFFLVTLVQQISNKKDSQYLQQTQKYPHKSNLKSSYPFLDYKGILTVGGRLQQSSLPSLPYLIIHQLISPIKHHFPGPMYLQYIWNWIMLWIKMATVLDICHQEYGQIIHLPMFDMLSLWGSSTTTSPGWTPTCENTTLQNI